MQGEQGEQGPQGERGPRGKRGVAGTNGVDGQNGVDGAPGLDGEDGQNGQSCSLVREDTQCYGPHLRYDLIIECGDDSQNLGRFTESHSEQCDD